MDAEKFELLDAKIRETTLLVSRLREEKRRVEEENAQLRQRIAELETALQEVEANASRYAPDIDSLLAQLDTLNSDVDASVVDVDPVAAALDDLEARPSKGPGDYYELGRLHEQKSHYDQAIAAYQAGLRLDPQHLDTMQRLAFLLEKLNRDAEAAPWWDKIWAMQGAQTNPRRRRSR
jgi:septal ring factor EnvC (AmiA/AmiB activator)